MATRFYNLVKKHLARFAKLMTAPSYIIFFNFSFPFSIESFDPNEVMAKAYMAQAQKPAIEDQSPKESPKQSSVQDGPLAFLGK